MATQDEKWRKFIRYEKVLRIINSKPGIIIGIISGLFLVIMMPFFLIKNIERKQTFEIFCCIIGIAVGVNSIITGIIQAKRLNKTITQHDEFT